MREPSPGAQHWPPIHQRRCRGWQEHPGGCKNVWPSQLWPRLLSAVTKKSRGGGEKERETVTRAPSLEPHGARPGQVTAFFTAWLRRGLLPRRQWALPLHSYFRCHPKVKPHQVQPFHFPTGGAAEEWVTQLSSIYKAAGSSHSGRDRPGQAGGGPPQEAPGSWALGYTTGLPSAGQGTREPARGVCSHGPVSRQAESLPGLLGTGFMGSGCRQAPGKPNLSARHSQGKGDGYPRIII